MTCCWHDAGRSGEQAAGSQEELKLLDVTVTGTQLERVIQRGKALAADARQRYESGTQEEPATAQPLKKRKKVELLVSLTWTHLTDWTMQVSSLVGDDCQVYRFWREATAFPTVVLGGRLTSLLGSCTSVASLSAHDLCWNVIERATIAVGSAGLYSGRSTADLLQGRSYMCAESRLENWRDGRCLHCDLMRACMRSQSGTRAVPPRRRRWCAPMTA